MTIPVLEQLKSDEFQAKTGFVATAPALRRLLLRTPEVRALRQALISGALTERRIQAFVRSLLSTLRSGVPMQHDLALAALAVALEKRGTAFAGEYLHTLASLQAAEMSMSIRVARESLKSRTSLSGTERTFIRAGIVMPKTFPYEQLGERFFSTSRTFQDATEPTVSLNPLPREVG